MPPASDEDLLARQSALQDEAREVLAELDLAALVADVGPLLVTGSFVSGLMCWRELDVMVLVGRDFSPQDVMGLLARIVRRAGVTGLEYRDERGARCVTGQFRDERYHVTLTVEHAGRWQIDLTLWLHDLHRNVTCWHEELRERITADQRIAVLRIKDDWHRRPGYPHHVGGLDIYTAVIDDGIRTLDQFASWLVQRGRVTSSHQPLSGIAGFGEIPARGLLTSCSCPGRPWPLGRRLLPGCQGHGEQIRRYAALCAEDASCRSRAPDLEAALHSAYQHIPDRWWFLPVKQGNVQVAAFFGLMNATSDGGGPLNGPMTIDTLLARRPGRRKRRLAAAADEPAGLPPRTGVGRSRRDRPERRCLRPEPL